MLQLLLLDMKLIAGILLVFELFDTLLVLLIVLRTLVYHLLQSIVLYLFCFLILDLFLNHDVLVVFVLFLNVSLKKSTVFLKLCFLHSLL
jgi:hypothetical protein